VFCGTEEFSRAKVGCVVAKPGGEFLGAGAGWELHGLAEVRMEHGRSRGQTVQRGGRFPFPFPAAIRRPVGTVRAGHRTRAVGQWLARVWDRRGRSAGAGAFCESAAAAVSPCAGGGSISPLTGGRCGEPSPLERGAGDLGGDVGQGSREGKDFSPSKWTILPG
jgi:hypothetical protein